MSKTQEILTAPDTKENLINLLQDNTLTILFRKVDGTERIIKCTLQESVVKPHEKKTDRVKKVNDNIISVWDIENEGWRSFRYDSVLEIHK